MSNITTTDATCQPCTHLSPAAHRRFEWIVTLLSGWLLSGLFLDGWAHTHGQVDETFFTPWHAAFYSGFLALAGVLVGHTVRHVVRRRQWRTALPVGYELSLLGTAIFWSGGVADMLWHTLFGVEEGVDALLSPTHLLLAAGIWLIVGGPFRAAWRRRESRPGQWQQQLPMLLSLTFMLSACTFITQIAHPLANLWGGGSPPQNQLGSLQEMGVISMLWDVGLLMGMLMFTMRRWTLPRGALTLVITLNAVGMGFLYPHGPYPLLLVLARAVAGFAADLLYARLKSSGARPGAWRLFAFMTSTLLVALYFLALVFTAGVWWSVHMWTGMIVLAGITGLLLSYLVVPPTLPTPDTA